MESEQIGADRREVLEKIAGMSEIKRRLLERRLRDSGLVPGSVTDALRAPNESEFPLSFGQQRLWFLEKLDPGGAVHNIPVAVRLRGRLDRGVLRRVFEEVVRRHEILRTVFVERDGVAWQQVLNGLELPLREVDLTGLEASAREEEARRLIAGEAREPFDLAQGPLFRLALLRIADEEWVLLAVMHHIISDGWSMGVFIGEFATLYRAFAEGQPSPLTPLGWQYADYSRWQRQHGESLEPELAYWQSKLSASDEPLDLPTDRSRPARMTTSGASFDFRLESDLTARLVSLAREEGATLFMVLLAGFQVLLARSSGQERISVGTPIANRQRREFESLIGFFVNTLVIRTDFSGDPSFREALRRVREASLGAYAHQSLPFEKLVEALGADRDQSRTPLFQAMFALQNTPGGDLHLPGVSIEPVEAETGEAACDLTIVLIERDGGLSGAVEYNRDLFDRETVASLIERYRLLLNSAAGDPDMAIGGLRWMSEEERRQVLVDWNPPLSDYPRDRCIHELIAEAAGRVPEAVAITDGVSLLRYRELEERSNRLARRLRRMGVGPEAIVGLCLERSPSLLVAILAIWKAGGAYIPLDPLHPAGRRRSILQDAGAKLLLTQDSIGSEEMGAIDVLSLDGDGELIAAESPDPVRSDLRPDNLAYVLYTSGSTGKPKGVMVPHRGLVNAWHGWREAYGLGESGEVRSFLGIANTTFDVFVGDFIRPLADGHKLVLCPRELLLEPAGFFDLMVREQVDYLEVVPAVLRPLLVWLEGSGRRLDFLRVVVCGADAWLVSEYRRLKQLCGPRTRVFNSYGVTEATIDNTWYEGDPETSRDDEVLPLGVACANQQLYVLDSRLQPQPVGVPGELCIGGDGVARGYLNDQPLTAERFIEWCAVDGEPPRRIYRTGDRACWRRDGKVRFYGRGDLQVKIRGYRIEPGEIEAALRQHPGIGEAAVAARRDPGGESWLAAWVSGRDGAPVPDAGALRAHLRERLPDYMVPAVFVPLDEMPLTSSGKVARRELPEPDRTAVAGAEAQVGPRSATERRLAEIWAALLRRERVGAEVSFFDIGGHSLLATQVISRVRNEFGVEVPLRSIFESPTISGLAKRVEEALRESGRPIPTTIPPALRLDQIPLSFGQQRLWFFDQYEPGSGAYNIPAAVRLEGDLDPQLLTAAINEVVRRHEVLRTSFTVVDGRPFQVIATESSLRIPLADLSHLPPEEREAEVGRIVREESLRPFDLASGPLLRVCLWRLAEREHLMTIVMHHIIADGWSTGLLIGELVEICRARLAGAEPSLPELPIQYADYACWQRERLSGTFLESEVAWWRERLGDGGEYLALPTDRPRPATLTDRGGSHEFVLSAELTERLAALCRTEGVTLFMALLAGFKALLQRYSGQEQISVGTPIANRHYLEVEPLIGFFANTLVMRTDLGGAPSFRELLARVRETALGAYAHQDMPFDKLVDALGVDRHPGYTPLFQAMFVMQNVPRREATIEGLTLREVAIETGKSNFDLTLAISGEEMLAGAVEYNADLFDAETIGRMFDHFRRLLEAAVADPDRQIAMLPMIGAEERRQVLFDWNETLIDLPLGDCVHYQIERQAEAHPGAVAVVWPGSAEHAASTLTYGELDRRASQLAHALRRCGIGPEKIVGLCLERSPELLVAILAVWKAGGAYLPLDPLHPAERIGTILRDAAARVVLTTEPLLPLIAGLDVDILCLDRDREQLGREPATRPSPTSGPQNLAYVIYTSGSTGTPKGVMVDHRSLVNAVCGWRMAYDLDSLSSFLGIAGVTFDVFLGDLLRPLTMGARFILCPREILFTPPDLYRLLTEESVDYFECVPAVLRPLADYLEESGRRLDALKVLVCGADLWTVGEYRRIARLCRAQTRIFNSYGVTEATIDNTWYEGDLAGYRDDQTLPLGVGCANQQIYVLDDRLQPQPIGVPGELCIGGESVARGYLDRPELTAEKFRLWHRDGADQPPVRIYRTGDLARWRSSGQIEFLGRADQQVKIRGYRIETGEIEAALRQHPSVREALVVAIQDGSDRRRLAGYVVADPPGESIDRGALRAHLGRLLPEYMIPAALVELESLPVTAHGKVDRRRLPAPRFESATTDSGPRNATEEALLVIWREALGSERIGIAENFFELGGDSILTIQVVARARREGILLTPKMIFENPTISSLAMAAGHGEVITAEQGPVVGPVILTPIQRWFFERRFADCWHWNQSVLLEVDRAAGRERIAEALRRLLAHHDALRLRYREVAEGWEQYLSPPVDDLPLLWHDLTQRPRAGLSETIRKLGAELQASLQPDGGSLLRAAGFDPGNGEPLRLLLVIHHLAVDAVSWRILLEDLAALLDPSAADHPPGLPAKTTSFRDWAARIDQYAQSTSVTGQLDYWMKVVTGAGARLPVDIPGGTNREVDQQRVVVSLDERETEALRRAVHSVSGADLEEALLTGLGECLTRWAGASALLVSLEGHGREDIFPAVDLSRTVGWFTTEYPVRLEATGSDGIVAALRETRERRQAIPEKGLGFGLLRYLTRDESIRQRIDQLPSPRIGFNYFGHAGGAAAGSSSILRPAAEDAGPMRSPRAEAANLIDISGALIDGALQFEWNFSTEIFHRTTIEDLAQSFIAALRRLTAECEASRSAVYTPSDFQLAGLDHRRLAKVIGRLEQSTKASGTGESRHSGKESR